MCRILTSACHDGWLFAGLHARAGLQLVACSWKLLQNTCMLIAISVAGIHCLYWHFLCHDNRVGFSSLHIVLLDPWLSIVATAPVFRLLFRNACAVHPTVVGSSEFVQKTANQTRWTRRRRRSQLRRLRNRGQRSAKPASGRTIVLSVGRKRVTWWCVTIPTARKSTTWHAWRSTKYHTVPGGARITFATNALPRLSSSVPSAHRPVAAAIQMSCGPTPAVAWCAVGMTNLTPCQLGHACEWR